MPVTFWHIGIDDESNELVNFHPMRPGYSAEEDEGNPSMANKRIIGVFVTVVTKNRKADYFSDISLGYELFDEDGKSKRNRKLELMAAVDSLDSENEYEPKVVIMQPKVKLKDAQRQKIIEYFNKRSNGVWDRTSAKVKTQLT